MKLLEAVKSRAVLSQIIGKRIALKSDGRSHKGLCPFHKEKTPSFVVHDEKGFFYCFGCGAKGDVVGFIERFEHKNFLEALEVLAQELGIDSKAFASQKHAHYDKTKDVGYNLHTITKWLEYNLHENPEGVVAMRYLQRRGISPAQAKKFRLGYCPQNMTRVTRYIQSASLSQEILQESGFLSASNRGLYSQFLGRLIFPIIDRDRQIIAFGGRVLDNNLKTAKYVNSRTSEFFHKKETFYGNTFSAIERSGVAILVEGYMDVIMLDVAGFHNALAVLGTAISVTHIQAIKAVAQNAKIYVFMDGDSAGQRSKDRLINALLQNIEHAHNVLFVNSPQGRDPADVASDGATAVQSLLDAAQTLSQVIFSSLAVQYDLDVIEHFDHALQAVKIITGAIQDPVKRKQYHQAIVKKMYEARRARNQFTKFDSAAPPSAAMPADSKKAAAILSLALKYPALAARHEEEFGMLIVPEELRALHEALINKMYKPQECEKQVDSGLILSGNRVDYSDVLCLVPRYILNLMDSLPDMPAAEERFVAALRSVNSRT